MSFLVYPTIKQAPILSMLGFGGGGTALALGGATPLVTYTMTKSSNHDNYNEGTGLTSGVCGGSNKAVVSDASTTTVVMTLSFTPSVTNITSWNICTANAGSNGFTISYRFNGTGSYTSTGVSGSSATSVDLTSAAQAVGTVSDFQLSGGGGSGNSHIYLWYLEINGVYPTGVGSPTHTWVFQA